MVAEKYQTLEKLYQLLLAKQIQAVDELLTQLQLTENELLSHVAELKTMGLEVFANSKSIRLDSTIDTIDINYLHQQLKSKQINKPLSYYFTAKSSNLLARQNKTPVIVLCDHQTQGKGRQNKAWLTPLGQSIAISISHQFNLGLSTLTGLNIAIAVAVIDCIEQFGEHQLSLKWPNDVIGKKGKVAGILIEASGNSQMSFVVIGIGINWNLSQKLLDGIEQECMNLELDQVTRNEFIVALVNQIEKQLAEFAQNQLENTIHRWHKYDGFVGKDIQIIQEGQSQKARYLQVDANGYLQVEINGTIKPLATGVVSIRKVD